MPPAPRIRALSASLAICLAGAVPAWSQSRIDAKGDPVTWLKAYLGGAACVVYEAGPSPFRMQHVNENTEVLFDGCAMTLQQASIIDEHSELRTFRIPLGLLPADAVKSTKGFFLPEGWLTRGDVPTHTITISGPAGRQLITQSVDLFDGSTPKAYPTDEVTVLVRHEENARQIVVALTSAIERCRP